MEIAVGADPRGGEAHCADVVAPGAVLLAVAEGFGTVRGIAAATAATTGLRESVRRRLRKHRDPAAALGGAIKAVNQRLYASSGSHDDFVASGTSLTAALVVGERAFVAHAGRTHAVVCREGLPASLTRDDLLVTESESLGSFAERATRGARAPSSDVAILTRTLGTEPSVEIAVDLVHLDPLDVMVLVTPAVHRVLGDDEIAMAVRGSLGAEDAAARVLSVAERRAAGGIAIVGRGFDTPAESVRAVDGARIASIGLALLLIAALLAGIALHGVVAP